MQFISAQSNDKSCPESVCFSQLGINEAKDKSAHTHVSTL